MKRFGIFLSCVAVVLLIRAAVGLQSPSVQVFVSDFTLDYTPESRSVSLIPASGEATKTGTSDSDGQVGFVNVTPGLWTLRIAGIGLSDLTIQVPNYTGTLNVTNLITSDWTPPSAVPFAAATPTLRDLSTRLSIVNDALALDGEPLADTIWTNDTSGGNAILENIDQTKNLFSANYASGDVWITTYGSAPVYGGNVVLGNASPAGTNISNTVLIGNSPGASGTTMSKSVAIGNASIQDMVTSTSTIALGYLSGRSGTTDFKSVFIGDSTGPQAATATTNCIFIGQSATSGGSVLTPTNIIVIAPNQVATNDNAVIIGTSASLFHTDTLGNTTGRTYTLTGTTNQVIFGGTNTAPVSAVAPAKWISVQVSGLPNVYRLPLYE